MFGQRQGIVVYIQSLRQVKFLRKLGNIHFVSKRLKYVFLYVDAEKVASTVEWLERQKYVKKIEISQRPFVKTEFEGKKEDKYADERSFTMLSW